MNFTNVFPYEKFGMDTQCSNHVVTWIQYTLTFKISPCTVPSISVHEITNIVKTHLHGHPSVRFAQQIAKFCLAHTLHVHSASDKKHIHVLFYVPQPRVE